MNLDKNLIWALSDIGNSDTEYFSVDDYELHGETEEGADCSCQISVIDVCAEASEKLIEQQKEIEKLKESISYCSGSCRSDNKPKAIFAEKLKKEIVELKSTTIPISKLETVDVYRDENTNEYVFLDDLKQLIKEVKLK